MNNAFSSDRVEKATRSSLAENAKRKHLRTVSAWFAAMLIGGVLGYLQLPEINRWPPLCPVEFQVAQQCWWS